MLNASPVYCDITELVTNPVRTGIQRVVREIIRNWDGPRPLRLCHFHSKQRALVGLPDAVTYYLTEPDEPTRSAPVGQIAERLSELIAANKSTEVPGEATIFVPEVFFDEARARHLLWRLKRSPENVFALFFDFIPWLHPQVIGVQRSHPLMWYVRFAQHVQRAAFISDSTRSDWCTRILKDQSRNGVVLPLGADGLRVSRQTFDRKKRNFVALGSIDGRKNQLSILRAFKKLWAEGNEVQLTLVGRVFEAESDIRGELDSAATYSQFRHVERATDGDVGEILSTARATIYASTIEGYGLPPVESLYAGIPCIASKRVPSVANLAKGVRFLDEATPEEIEEQVRLLLDQGEAEKAWKEAAKLNLPTWQQFGSATAEWIAN